MKIYIESSELLTSSAMVLYLGRLKSQGVVEGVNHKGTKKYTHLCSMHISFH